MFCAFELDPEAFAVQKPPRFGRSPIRSRHQLDYYQAQHFSIALRRPRRWAPSQGLGSAAETTGGAATLDALTRSRSAPGSARRARRGRASSAELRFETSADAGIGEFKNKSKSRVERKKEVPMMRVVAELMIAANAAVATARARAHGC